MRPLPFFEVRFVGSAGQTFGAFTTDGMRLTLEGEANDYLGKGMSGGEIVLMPADMARFAPHKNTIVGNTVLYGATGGACSPRAAPASASACATRAPRPSSKASATTAAST